MNPDLTEDADLDQDNPQDRATRSHRSWLARGVLATTLLYTLRVASDAQAQEPARQPANVPYAQVQPADKNVRRFAIPGGALGDVLTRFRDATGLSIEVADPAMATLASPGVSGSFTAEQALAELLEGTGLTYRFTAAGAVRIEVPGVSADIEVTAPAAPASPKYTEPLRDTPQSIAIVSQELLEEQAVTTLRDALRNVTGISIQAGEGGVPAGDNLAIRGFNARTDIFVDGVRDIGGYTRDTFNLEQVEVVKGPASLYGGRGSTGGSVNMITKAPFLAAAQSGTVAAGTDDFGRLTLDVNRPLDALPVDGAALRLNAMVTHAGTPGRDEVKSERWGVAPTLTFGLGSATQLTLGYFHLEQDNVPDYGIPWVPANNVPLADLADQPAPVPFDNFYGLTDRDYEETATGIATAEVTHAFDSGLTFRNLLRYGSTERDSVITAPRFVSATSTDVRRTDMKSRDQTDTILSNQADLTAGFTTGGVEHRLVTGVEVGYETSQNYARAEVGPTPPDTDLFNPTPGDPYVGSVERTGAKDEADATTVSVYASDTLELSPRWQLNAGARWDRFDLDFESATFADERTDEAVSWRAAAVYKPVPAGTFYAGFGTSFEPVSGSLSLRSNVAGLDPEKSVSAEVGTKWDLAGGRLRLNAALFRTEKTNAQTPGLDPDDPPIVLDGEVRVEGVEVGFAGQLTERWSASLGYTFMESEIVESNNPAELGNPLGNTPDHSLSLWTTYRHRRLELGAGVQYVGDRFSNNTAARKAPGYWVVDAMAGYDFNDRLTLRLNVYNLADERYIDRVGGGHFIPGPGRSVALTQGFSF